MIKKVLIPAKQDQNPFFDSISKYSTWEFDYGNLYSNIEGYTVVLIHWPEQLFNWKEPNDIELINLEEILLKWKQNVRIVYVVHNERRHLYSTKNTEKLYSLVLKHCDALVHFGQHSLKKYKMVYPKSLHSYIPHPLYETPFKIYNKIEARNRLNIPLDKKVLIVPGNIRSKEERNLILSTFKKLKLKNKFLLVPRMYYKQIDIDFPGRFKLKLIIDVKYIIEKLYNKTYNNSMRFNYSFVDFEELSLNMSAADVVMIPRINSLNSGNVFLGIYFNRVVVGPDIGNISEILHDFNLPIFDPSDAKSVVKALKEGFQLVSEKYKYPVNLVNKLTPKEVAKRWDLFLSFLIKN